MADTRISTARGVTADPGHQRGLLVRFPPGVARACLFAIPLFTSLHTGTAAEVPPAAPAVGSAQAASFAAGKAQDGSPTISYVDGKLTIHAANATLPNILAKVSALIGVSIDMPDGGAGDAMPLVQLGPGPAREVLASLLDGAHFDYMMQADEADAEKLQSVLIMLRKRPGSEAGGADSPTPRSPYARIPQPVVEPDQTEASTTSVPAPPEITAADAGSSNPQSAPAQPDLSASAASSQREISNSSARAGQLTPPATLTPQSMSEQLQQMYQQRMQMIQQGRPAAAPAAQQ